jgi:MFS family permease
MVNTDTLKKPWYRWYALGILLLVYTSSHVDRQIMGILLEPIKTELNASDTQMGFLVGLTFAIFYATLGIPIAMLADRSNRRNIIAIATTIWSGMTAVCALVGSYGQLALARIGVGIGEAGSSPPSHSMISDLFPQSERGTAMGIFAIGVNLGLLIAYLGGGWMSEHWGWRTTFIVVGLPGLLIALLVRFTLVEPPRGGVEAEPKDVAKAPSFKEVARTLWRTPAARHVIFGSSLAGFVGYGMTLWLPAFFVRSHGLTQTETGMTLALMTGVVGGLGTFMAGRLADTLGKRDPRWLAWVVAVGKGGAGALSCGVLLDHGFKVGVGRLFDPGIFRWVLPCTHLCHGPAVSAGANAGGGCCDLPLLAQHHWYGVWSTGRRHFERLLGSRLWR